MEGSSCSAWVNASMASLNLPSWVNWRPLAFSDAAVGPVTGGFSFFTTFGAGAGGTSTFGSGAGGEAGAEAGAGAGGVAGGASVFGSGLGSGFGSGSVSTLESFTDVVS